jgi:ketosteroid isomerase-like protein
MKTNKEIGLAAINAMDSRDLAGLGELLEANARWHIPVSAKRAGLDEVLVGREKIVDMVRMAYAKNYKLLKITVEHVVVEGDFVVALCRTRITAFSDKHSENHYVYFMRLKNGLISEAWELTDTANIFELLSSAA